LAVLQRYGVHRQESAGTNTKELSLFVGVQHRAISNDRDDLAVPKCD
jgi:hypothetical protein